MEFTYWYLFPVALVIAILANSSGFSGGVLFQPIYNLFLDIPLANSVATGIATETIGMSSGAARYFFQGKIEKGVGLVLVMLTIPGVVFGTHIILVINPNILRFVLGIVIISIAVLQLTTATQGKFGTRENLQVEEIYPLMWIPFLGGLFSSTTGTGIAESSQPLLEQGLKLKTRRANATAIWVEAMGDWIITILNLQAGLIMPEILLFTGTGVIIGGQIGPIVAKYLPEKTLKIFFASAIIVIGVFYITTGGSWILTRLGVLN